MIDLNYEFADSISNHQKACIELGMEFTDENYRLVVAARKELLSYTTLMKKDICNKVTNHFESYTNAQSGKILADQVRELLK